jgi:hypothetical protein
MAIKPAATNHKPARIVKPLGKRLANAGGVGGEFQALETGVPVFPNLGYGDQRMIGSSRTVKSGVRIWHCATRPMCHKKTGLFRALRRLA